MEQKPHLFDSEMVSRQLSYNGMVETVKIRSIGFSKRFLFKEFVSSFRILDKTLSENKTSINKFISTSKMPEKSFQIGKTKIFFRSEAYEIIEALRRKSLQTITLKLQSFFRMSLWRIKFKKKKKAALVLQKNIRIHQKNKKLKRKIKICLKITQLCEKKRLEEKKKKEEEERKKREEEEEKKKKQEEETKRKEEERKRKEEEEIKRKEEEEIKRKEKEEEERKKKEVLEKQEEEKKRMGEEEKKRKQEEETKKKQKEEEEKKRKTEEEKKKNEQQQHQHEKNNQTEEITIESNSGNTNEDPTETNDDEQTKFKLNFNGLKHESPKDCLSPMRDSEKLKKSGKELKVANVEKIGSPTIERGNSFLDNLDEKNGDEYNPKFFSEDSSNTSEPLELNNEIKSKLKKIDEINLPTQEEEMTRIAKALQKKVKGQKPAVADKLFSRSIELYEEAIKLNPSQDNHINCATALINWVCLKLVMPSYSNKEESCMKHLENAQQMLEIALSLCLDQEGTHAAQERLKKIEVVKKRVIEEDLKTIDQKKKTQLKEKLVLEISKIKAVKKTILFLLFFIIFLFYLIFISFLKPKKKKVTMIGKLTKQGAGNTTFGRKSWKDRIFVLNEKFLRYYVKSPNEPPKGEIALTEVVGVKMCKVPGKEHTFAVSTPNRYYPIVAANENELKDWVVSINTNLNRLRLIEKLDSLK